VAISVFIICKNEERIIERTLMQARMLADELIVVDSGSTDGTIEIAKRYADKLVHQDWLGYAAQKNYALSLCTQDWCLSLDADEVLPDALIAEIKSSLGGAQRLSNDEAYAIARKLYLGSKWLRFGGYYPDYHLRLFPRGAAKFAQRAVHESLTLEPGIRVHKLKHALEHYAYDDIDDMRQSYIHYAELGRKPSSFALLRAVFAFVWRYLVRLGFLHGSLGIKLAWLQAEYSYRKYHQETSSS